LLASAFHHHSATSTISRNAFYDDPPCFFFFYYFSVCFRHFFNDHPQSSDGIVLFLISVEDKSRANEREEIKPHKIAKQKSLIWVRFIRNCEM
jgi:hypothetical protein